MKLIPSSFVLALCLLTYSHAETEASKTIVVRYIEGYQDKTVVGRRYAIFQREDKKKEKFRVYIPQGWSEDTDTNTHHILTIIKAFPTVSKETPKGSAYERLFEPLGTLIFYAPFEEPEKNISNWKLKELKPIKA